MAGVKTSPAVKYAKWCVREDNKKAPRYVKAQAQQWLDIVYRKDRAARIDEAAYDRICALLKLMRHPDLNCSMYEGLEDYAWLLIVAVFCTVTPDGRRYYETALLEIARKNFKTFNSARRYIYFAYAHRAAFFAVFFCRTRPQAFQRAKNRDQKNYQVLPCPRG